MSVDDEARKEPQEEEQEASTGDQVVYRKDRPVFTFVRNLLIGVVVTLTLLFVVGFIMGLTQTRAPFIDPQVISDQWEKRVSGEVSGSWNELERTPEQEREAAREEG